MLVMSKRKKVSGKHSTPRKPVQFPEDWLQVLKELAAERPMPAVWLLVELLKAHAETKGRKNLPPVPWAIEKGSP
jgi:hypothetical protein